MNRCWENKVFRQQIHRREKMEKIKTKGVPEAIGPYSQAIKTGNLVFTAGQIALDPQTNQMIVRGFEAFNGLPIFITK